MKSALLALVLLTAAGCSRFAVSDFIGAARNGDLPKLTTALNHGADPNERGGVNNWTVLLHAIHKNQAGSVHFLLEHGADPNSTFGHGTTPLIMAAGYGYASIVEDLLAHGANPKKADDTGFGPLDAAVGGVADIDRFTVGKCQGATVKVILDHAPGVRLQDATAARIATFSGCGEVLRLIAIQ